MELFIFAVLLIAILILLLLRIKHAAGKAASEDEKRYFSVLLNYKQSNGVWVGSFYRHGVFCYAEVYGIPDTCECAGLEVWAIPVGFAERHLMEAKTFLSPYYCCGYETVIMADFDRHKKGWRCEYHLDGIAFCGIVYGRGEDEDLEGCSLNVVKAPECGANAFRVMI